MPGLQPGIRERARRTEIELELFFGDAFLRVSYTDSRHISASRQIYLTAWRHLRPSSTQIWGCIFSGIMADVPQLIKVSVALKTTPNDGPVYFKTDGTRFDQNRTIKLLTGTKYKIEVVVKPGAVQATWVSSRVTRDMELKWWFWGPHSEGNVEECTGVKIFAFQHGMHHCALHLSCHLGL